jgi:hypothetical protein
MTGALLIVTGTIFFVVAWVALVGASFFVLRDFLGEARSLGVIVAANALIGFAVMAIGRRMASVRPSA